MAYHILIVTTDSFRPSLFVQHGHLIVPWIAPFLTPSLIISRLSRLCHIIARSARDDSIWRPFLSTYYPTRILPSSSSSCSSFYSLFIKRYHAEMQLFHRINRFRFTTVKSSRYDVCVVKRENLKVLSVDELLEFQYEKDVEWREQEEHRNPKEKDEQVDEVHHDKQDDQGYSLLPLSSISSNHMLLDTVLLHSIMYDIPHGQYAVQRISRGDDIFEPRTWKQIPITQEVRNKYMEQYNQHDTKQMKITFTTTSSHNTETSSSLSLSTKFPSPTPISLFQFHLHDYLISMLLNANMGLACHKNQHGYNEFGTKDSDDEDEDDDCQSQCDEQEDSVKQEKLEACVASFIRDIIHLMTLSHNDIPHIYFTQYADTCHYDQFVAVINERYVFMLMLRYYDPNGRVLF